MYWRNMPPPSTGWKNTLSFPPVSASTLVGFFFNTEDGGDMFLRRVRSTTQKNVHFSSAFFPYPENSESFILFN
jgi:hypothetical protein